MSLWESCVSNRTVPHRNWEMGSRHANSPYCIILFSHRIYWICNLHFSWRGKKAHHHHHLISKWPSLCLSFAWVLRVMSLMGASAFAFVHWAVIFYHKLICIWIHTQYRLPVWSHLSYLSSYTFCLRVMWPVLYTLVSVHYSISGECN